MNYNPDTWVIVRIFNKETGKALHKLLAGWYGGYAGTDSWRINSGIVHIEKHSENPSLYCVQGFSGSVYTCHKSTERTSMLTNSIFLQLQEEAEKSGNYEVSLVPIEGLTIDKEEAGTFL